MTSVQATVSPPHLDLKAIYDDPEYAKDDDLKTFMSMRDNGHQTRRQYLDGLSAKRQERLTHERDRIASLRVKFFANPTKQDLIATHELRRKEWRDEAKENRKRHLNELQTRRLKFEASDPVPVEETAEKRNKLLNEERILNAILHWPPDEASATPQPTGQPEPGKNKGKYGLKACIMHFKKGGGGHTHKHLHEEVAGDFPNQKIPIEHLLKDSPNNPLKEECRDNMYRYFHLPTNNMAWIEVRISGEL